MNENVDKWIKALRSQEYQQASGALQRTNGFCCLGVLCDVYRKETGIGKWKLNYTKGAYDFIILDADADVEADVFLPVQVQDWVKLRTYRGTYTPHSSPTSLANDNDDGKSFSDIADIIESNPDHLFNE